MFLHRDSPPAHHDPRLEVADLYVFDADAATVLVMNVRTSLVGDDPPDPFHPQARYEFKIHFDGHEREDVSYRVAFSSAQAGRQDYTVQRLTGEAASNDAATGTVIADGHTGEPVTAAGGGRVWAGRAVDPFYLDLRQLHDVQRVVHQGEEVDLMGWARGAGEDSFAGATVTSIVLTVPLGADGLTTGRHLCTWATVRLATGAGGWRQTGRTGLPMLWPLFGPSDEQESSRVQETHPADDPAAYGPAIADLVSSTVERLGTSDRPDAYADSVVERIVADLLRYVVGSPAVFGFARFNGRRLSDNAPEAMFSLTTNSAVPTGLRVGDHTRSRETFPYVVPAHDRP